MKSWKQDGSDDYDQMNTPVSRRSYRRDVGDSFRTVVPRDKSCYVGDSLRAVVPRDKGCYADDVMEMRGSHKWQVTSIFIIK